jgi:hypothetical protein
LIGAVRPAAAEARFILDTQYVPSEPAAMIQRMAVRRWAAATLMREFRDAALDGKT